MMLNGLQKVQSAEENIGSRGAGLGRNKAFQTAAHVLPNRRIINFKHVFQCTIAKQGTEQKWPDYAMG
jgi:hypothetical protein